MECTVYSLKWWYAWVAIFFFISTFSSLGYTTVFIPWWSVERFNDDKKQRWEEGDDVKDGGNNCLTDDDGNTLKKGLTSRYYYKKFQPESSRASNAGGPLDSSTHQTKKEWKMAWFFPIWKYKSALEKTTLAVAAAATVLTLEPKLHANWECAVSNAIRTGNVVITNSTSSLAYTVSLKNWQTLDNSVWWIALFAFAVLQTFYVLQLSALKMHQMNVHLAVQICKDKDLSIFAQNKRWRADVITVSQEKLEAASTSLCACLFLWTSSAAYRNTICTIAHTGIDKFTATDIVTWRSSFAQLELATLVAAAVSLIVICSATFNIYVEQLRYATGAEDPWFGDLSILTSKKCYSGGICRSLRGIILRLAIETVMQPIAGFLDLLYIIARCMENIYHSFGKSTIRRGHRKIT